VLFVYPYEVVDGVRFEEWGPRGLLIREAVYPPTASPTVSSSGIHAMHVLSYITSLRSVT
jgi:hypothetical protein